MQTMGKQLPSIFYSYNFHDFSYRSKRFMHEQVAEPFYFLAVVQYLLINLFWNEKYVVSEGHWKELNMDVDLEEEA